MNDAEKLATIKRLCDLYHEVQDTMARPSDVDDATTLTTVIGRVLNGTEPDWARFVLDAQGRPFPSGDYCYLYLFITPAGLHLLLTHHGREFLEEHRVDALPEAEMHFDRAHESLWTDLLESYSTNGGPELLRGDDYHDIGALTEAPIIAYDVARHEGGGLYQVGRTFWFERYAIEDELETLLRTGQVVFPEAKEA